MKKAKKFAKMPISGHPESITEHFCTTHSRRPRSSQGRNCYLWHMCQSTCCWLLTFAPLLLVRDITKTNSFFTPPYNNIDLKKKCWGFPQCCLARNIISYTYKHLLMSKVPDTVFKKKNGGVFVKLARAPFAWLPGSIIFFRSWWAWDFLIGDLNVPGFTFPHTPFCHHF